MPTPNAPDPLLPPIVRRIVWGLMLVACMFTSLAARAQNAGELESMFVSPAAPTSQDAIVLHAITACSNPFNGEPAIDGRNITLQTYYLGLFPPCPALVPPFEVRFNLPRLAPGSYTVNVIGNGGVPIGAIVYSMVFQVAPADAPQPQEVSLAGGNFAVRIIHGGVAFDGAVLGGQPASAVTVSSESGYFWFFRSSDVEVTVKLLDGRPVNGHYWLFAASMTNEPYVLELIDTRPGCADTGTGIGSRCIKLYPNPAGTNRNVIDLEAASD